MTGIEHARLELAKWEAYVVEDQAALATVERQAADIRGRLADAVRCADSLRTAVQRWDAVHASNEPPNCNITG
jgi:hypothetical protein